MDANGFSCRIPIMDREINRALKTGRGVLMKVRAYLSQVENISFPAIGLKNVTMDLGSRKRDKE